jgi:polyisoprenoid-binding protein YceI
MSTSSSVALELSSGIALVPGTWVIDRNHSSVLFSIRHLGLARVRGRFETVDATLEVGPTLDETRIVAEIDLASINTNNADRDAHLRSTDFFDTTTHPTMRFASTRIVETSDGLTLTGDVTLNGVTRPISLDVEVNGKEVFSPTGNTHAGFSATGSIKRSDFGIEFGLLPIGGDRLALGDDVKIELDLEFIEPQ